jgi:alkylhydroperoxidase family enzyme
MTATPRNDPPAAAEPRVRPVEPPYSPDVAAAFERVMPKGVPPLSLFRALAVNERVLLRVVAGGFLDRGSISMRDREIVIDRTCFRCGSEYEWGVHVAFFGPRVGFTAEETRALCSDDPGDAFGPRERLLLSMCDRLHADAGIDDALWAALAREWTPEQLVELVMVAGFYHMIAFATNALRLPLEPFAARFGA